MIYFQTRVLTPEEEEILKVNSRFLDSIARRCPKRCANPYCQWMIPVDNNFRLLKFGDVCRLCYDMFHVLSESSYWNRISLEEGDDDKLQAA